MATLKTLWVIHKTGSGQGGLITRPGFPPIPSGDDAGSGERFNLWINNSRFRFPDRPEDRMPGKVQEYKFDVESADVDMDDIDGRNIEMEILGSNAWLPSSIWAIGEDITRDRKLLVHIPDWPTDQFWSTDRSKGEPRRFLRRIEIHDHRQ